MEPVSSSQENQSSEHLDGVIKASQRSLKSGVYKPFDDEQQFVMKAQRISDIQVKTEQSYCSECYADIMFRWMQNYIIV